jgi:hypothetical protein
MELHYNKEKNNDAPNLLLSSLSFLQSCTTLRKKSNHPLGVVILLFASCAIAIKKMATHPICCHHPLRKVGLQQNKTKQ